MVLTRQIRITRILALSAVLAASVAVIAPSVARAQVEDDLKDGDTAYEREDLKKAAAAYDRAIRRYPKQVAASAYGKRASIFLLLSAKAKSSGNVEQQQAMLEAGLKFVAQKGEPVHPGAPEILEYKALMLWELRSKPDAIKVAEKVVKAKPSIFSNQRLIGEFYAVREPKKAIKALAAYFRSRPSELEKGDVLPRIYLGFAYLSVARSLRRRDPKQARSLGEKARDEFEILLKKHRKRRHAAVNANNGLCSAYTFIGEYNRAITVCEAIIQNSRNIDRTGSVFFNLGQSYLQNRQPRKARTVGKEYIRLRKSEAKGYILVGDSYQQERNWTLALGQYQKAEEFAKNSSEYAADIGIRLGISYRRTNDLARAIAKLEAALDSDPENTRLITELGSAYIAARQDGKALARAESVLTSKNFPNLDVSQKAALLVLAGKSAYNIGAAKPAKPSSAARRKSDKAVARARKHFSAAFALRPKDVTVRIGLARTINLQAYRSFAANDAKQAQVYLNDALGVNSVAPLTNQNMAVFLLSKGKCVAARKRLQPLKKVRNYALMYNRLMARTYLCGGSAAKHKGARKQAIAHFAAAEKQAGNVNLVRAEIYTEWAPLIWNKNLDRAVEMLEAAVQFTAQNRTLGKAAQRNLALALYRRGWRDMRSRRGSKSNVARAAEDFARASRDPGLLRGTEAAALDFSEALARLERGETQKASKLFAKLAKAGNQAKYLKSPYNKVGAQFFGAYAKYRSGSAAGRRQAASAFARMLGSAKGSFGTKVRDLLAASYSELAVDAYRTGKSKQAGKQLASASRYATGATKNVVAHNQAVLKMGSKFNKNVLATFERMGSNPPEALANKGILLDRASKPKQAYDAWQRAKSKGVRARSVSSWISAKKRIFGY